MRSEAVHRMVPQQSTGADVLDGRLERQTIRRSGSVRVIRLLVVTENIGKAVVPSLLNVIDLFRVVGHRAMLRVDQPALIVPIESKGVAVAARIDLGHLLCLGRIEAKDAGGEVAAGKPWTAGDVRMRRLAELADRGIFPDFAVVRAGTAPQVD